MQVFPLWHAYETRVGAGEDEIVVDHEKLVGIYSTRTNAEEAQARTAKLPGFLDYPDGFVIDEYKVDEDHWREGFGDASVTDPTSDQPPR
jgi:hypothetical protein